MVEQLYALLHHLTVLAIIFMLALLGVAGIRVQAKEARRYKDGGLAAAPKGKAHGIIMGKNKLGRLVYSPTGREGHVCVFGGSGQGKTAAILIPTLRSWTGPFFCIDISGDIATNVTPTKSLRFEPSSRETVPYNVFALIDELEGDTDAQNEQLEKLAYLIMPDIPNASDASLFFNTEGRKILTGVLIAFYHAGLDFAEICRKIVGLGWRDLFRELDSQACEVASMYISSFKGTSEQNTGGCKQAVDAAVKLFALNKAVANALRRPRSGEASFTPRTLETTSVFMVVPDNLLDVYGPLMNIVISQSLTYFSTRTIGAKPTILFALDEFASLGKMDIIGALQKLRKRSVRLLVISQSMADLDRVYGETERKSMMANYRYQVVLGAADTETQEYFAKLIGHKKENTVSTTHGAGTSYTEREERVYAVEPEELGRLKKELIVIHPGGHERLQKAFYFKGQ